MTVVLHDTSSAVAKAEEAKHMQKTMRCPKEEEVSHNKKLKTQTQLQ
jgi:hypothetical protein